jgi:hypothetical protein
MRLRPPTLVLVAVSGLLAFATATAVPASATATHAAVAPHATTVHRVLFDDTKQETAGNADWIISTSMPDPTKQNAAPTKETDWTGALSAWGVALQRTGQYQLDTLPPGSTITFGTTATLDLSKFDELVLPEPNVLLSAAEKTAVMKFVQAGGGLFFITDHTGSDRNNDGADAVDVANDLMTSNSVDSTDPFGFSVDLKDISSDHPVPISSTTNPVLNGAFGVVKHSLIADGTTFTLKPADNPNVLGLLHLSTAAAGNTNNTFVTSTFGSGRVAFWDDSSPIDDGTGQPSNTLFVGWADPTADNAALGMNATAWLAQGSGTTTPPPPPPPGGGTCTASELLGNQGFETGTASPWATSASVIFSGTKEPARTGSFVAWLDGYGVTHTDTLSQTVTLPSGCTNYSLTYWLHIDTAETSSTAFDTMKAQVLNSSGTVLSTLATYTNVNAAAGFQQRSFSLAAFAGQTVTLKFTGVEGTQLQTSFVIDDTALNVS